MTTNDWGGTVPVRKGSAGCRTESDWLDACGVLRDTWLTKRYSIMILMRSIFRKLQCKQCGWPFFAFWELAFLGWNMTHSCELGLVAPCLLWGHSNRCDQMELSHCSSLELIPSSTAKQKMPRQMLHGLLPIWNTHHIVSASNGPGGQRRFQHGKTNNGSPSPNCRLRVLTATSTLAGTQG